MSKWPDYEFETGARPDPDWSTYRNFLYPSDEDFQRIGNREVIDRLREHGDQIEIARKIDHFAVFAKRDDRDAFARYLADHGYHVSETGDPADGRFEVAFDRVDPPADIDDVTIELFRAARKHHGEYDGWGCEAAR
jgi:regulator of RNase E activity RraB